jgi:hypothetical protein
MTKYKVGFCKPPKATQFRRGKSGNPRVVPRAAAISPPILQPNSASRSRREDGRQRRLHVIYFARIVWMVFVELRSARIWRIAIS